MSESSSTTIIASTALALPLHESEVAAAATAPPSTCSTTTAAMLTESPSSSASRFAACCWTLLRFVNTFAVAILAGVTIVLFLQVQYLTVTVQQEQAQLKDLSSKLANQTQGQIQALSERVEQEHSLTLYQMAGTFALLACLLASFHVYSHLRSHGELLVRRKIVAILWMSPVYAVTSFFSLVFPLAAGYLAVIKDFYEAYAIFTFLSFLIAVLGRGDRQVAVQVLSRHAEHLRQPTRCLNSCYHPPPSAGALAKANAVVTECQILAMQFVFVRPLTSIIGFACATFEDADGESGSSDDAYTFFKSPAFYLSMVTNVSVFLAFSGLLKFYHAVRDDLAWCHPFSKFMTIKGIVFLTFWQGLLVSIVVSSLEQQNHQSSQQSSRAYYGAEEIQNFLICLEMLFFSIAHYCVFPAEEWEPGYKPRELAKAGIGLKDFVSDVSYIISSSRRNKQGRTAVPSFDDEEQGEGQEEFCDADLGGNDGPGLDPEIQSSNNGIAATAASSNARRRSQLAVQEELVIIAEDPRDPVMISYQQGRTRDVS